jgi:hypothetical protein
MFDVEAKDCDVLLGEGNVIVRGGGKGRGGIRVVGC